VNDILPFVITGIATGAIYGLAGTGLVLTYKTSGIFNFGYGAIAATAAFLFYWLKQSVGLPWLPAALLSVFVFGPIAAVIFEFIGRLLAPQRLAMRVVGTIGLVLIVQGLAQLKYGDNTILIQQFLPKGNDTFRVFGTNITYAEVTISAIAVIAVVALWVMFRFTRIGLAMRAVVDDPDLVAMRAVSPRRVRLVAWGIGTTFAALCGVLIVPFIGLDALGLTLLTLQAFGAAAIGAFSSVTLTFLGGIAIGIVSAVSTNYVENVSWLSGLPSSLPFIALIIALIVLPRSKLASPVRAERPLRPPWEAPAPLRGLATIAVLALLVFIPSFAGTNLPAYTVGLTQGIALLSLGVLLREAGIVSLCQAAFAAIGAVAFSQFAINFHMPWLLAVMLGALVVVPIAALLAIPAIRLSGLFLALTTLGFGVMLEYMFYSQSFVFTTLAEGREMPRPSFAGSDRTYYYLVAAFFVVVALFTVAIHRGRLGRLLRGLSETPVAVSSLGLNLSVIRVIVFCISGLLAGMSGILYGCAVHFATSEDAHFQFFESILLLAILAISPMREPWYALLAAVASVIPVYWTSSDATYYLNVIFGLGAVLVACQGGPQTAPAALRHWAERVFGRTRPVAAVGAPGVGERVPVAERGTEAAPLAVRDVCVRYGGNVAVNSVSLQALAGSITGLIGPNGAGKTSLFNAISGLVKTSSGQVSNWGVPITRMSPPRRGRRGLGRTFQLMQLGDSLSVEHNILIGHEAPAAGRHVLAPLAARPSERRTSTQAVAEAMAMCGVADLADRPAGELSTGQRRLVELARCLAGPFDLLLLDEPTSGLDPLETGRFAEVLLDVVRIRNVSVMLVEHDMGFVMKVCSYIYVLDYGNLLYEGTPAGVAASDVVRAAYLGSDAANLAAPTAEASDV
jgi:ABC-type branched-subunit amino acid transport system ATPase component/branched-subunit amino acid ABC-type transport system permease component